MIVIAGTPSEPPVARLMEEAHVLGEQILMLDETEAADWNLQVEARPNGLTAQVSTRTGQHRLDEASGLYLRITAPRTSGPVPDPLRRERHDAALGLICSWAEVAALRVANRPAAMASNSSKPYQAARIRACGFSVPDTLVTSEPGRVRDFHAHHGRLIYKSTSGVRSIVHELSPARVAVLDRVRNLPTQFQQLLTGVNVRVHVIGSRLFACEIASDTIDYRYSEGGTSSTMTPVELPPDVAERCLALSAALELPLAGIDLLRDADDHWWCFEVNPSPAYTCFEEPTGLPMAAALARWLADDDGAG